MKRYEQLTARETHHVLLESARGGSYSIAGIHPIAKAKGKDGMTTIHYQDEVLFKEGDPFRAFTDWFQTLQTETNDEYPDFQGGAIGFLSYDYARYIEHFKMLAIDDLQTPDLYFLVFNDVAVFDHEKNALWLITHIEEAESGSEANQRLEEWKQKWTSSSEESAQSPVNESSTEFVPAAPFTEETFGEAVEKIKQYIANGDVFQVNLSIRQDEQLHTHPYDLYKTLRQVNPSPYMSYLHTPDFQIVCGSPELLIKKKELS
ncbi:hypothetical protein BsIDN1_01490 [Bacillus safensis]|uniref:Chorismate-utilising enzyme C-terminal domain-containing protein n=1 Tax=Bacillus safensis TaxID=561879 RepID=A0A5S9M0L7_BACIA|nr:hypothetical protein BsIDN1_01490 [Bacillus safensis]